MKILITGGAGFIAKSLFDELNQLYDVILCSRTDLDLLEPQAVFEYIKRFQFDVVIHAATYDAAPTCSIKNPSKVLENNLKMFFNIVRCQNYFGRLIYFGSGAEYDRNYWVPKMKESYFDRHIPTDQYGFSKYIMTKYMQHSKNIYNLRLFGVFGKYDDWRYRFIPNACCRALLGRPIVIRQNKMFDFMYIDDLVEIVKWIILAQPIENIYNVCSGRALELKAIAKTIVEVSGKQSEIICLESQLASEYSGDNALLLSELKDFRFYGIEQAIQNLYDWYASNVSLICEDQLC